MARARYIWLFYNYNTYRVIGAWTVKREMVRWLKQSPEPPDQRIWTVLRFRDGQPDKATEIPWEEIL